MEKERKAAKEMAAQEATAAEVGAAQEKSDVAQHTGWGPAKGPAGGATATHGGFWMNPAATESNGSLRVRAQQKVQSLQMEPGKKSRMHCNT